MDRPFDRGDLLLFILGEHHAGRAQGSGLSIESGKVRHPVMPANEVIIAERRSGYHRTGERLGGIQVVGRSPTEWKLALGGCDPDHAQGNSRARGWFDQCHWRLVTG